VLWAYSKSCYAWANTESGLQNSWYDWSIKRFGGGPALRGALTGLARAPDMQRDAGMDPCENSAIGGRAGITPDVLAQRERLVFDWCRNRQVPIAFVLAGGYVGERLSQDDLVDLHRLTLAAAASPVDLGRPGHSPKKGDTRRIAARLSVLADLIPANRSNRVVQVVAGFVIDQGVGGIREEPIMWRDAGCSSL
jgi:hypothetical protein